MHCFDYRITLFVFINKFTLIFWSNVKNTTETNNTSVVSLIAPPTEEIFALYGMLNQEATQAACIKSRVNRQAVQTAITMAARWVAAMRHDGFQPQLEMAKEPSNKLRRRI